MQRPSFPSRLLQAIFLSFLLLGGTPFAISLAEAKQKKSAPQQQIWMGKVVGVADGDTITVLVKKQPRKIRLYGVDTPEKKQAYGAKAKQFTSSLVFGQYVTVSVMSKDRYGRYVGMVYLSDGRILNYELVREGYAWWYQHYAPKDKELQNLEQKARLEKRHLWSDKQAVAPWVFRQQSRSR